MKKRGRKKLMSPEKEEEELPPYHLFDSISLCCESHEITKLHQPGASVKGPEILSLVCKVR